MKICSQCAHCSTKSSTGMWYEYFCKNPKIKGHMPLIDPVSGRKMFVDQKGILTDHKFPYCRDINKNGACSFWEE